MDEYEVDLRDYLIVIWERKWIIVGVLIAALVAAAAYSYTLPNEYRASALVDYQSSPVVSAATGAENFSLGLPDTAGFISVVESMGSASAEKLNGSDLIRLQVTGTSTPSDLANQLQETIDSVRSFLQDQMETHVTDRLSTLGSEIEFVRDQRSSLVERIRQRETARLEALQAQRDRIVEQLDRLMSNSSDSASNESSLSRQATLLAMTSQLQVIQGQMARLNSSADTPQPEPGSAYEQRLLELETQLQELALMKRQYERIREADWSPVSVAQAPQSSDTPVGPNRRLNIAIAGVLGLFIGLLLAFFVHYLQSEPLTARRQTETEQETEA
ncbi:MAG: Wzz/FepE/Etk N-terminal domain-containing protein [Candidatus Bipolaricaulia bacterium]